MATLNDVLTMLYTKAIERHEFDLLAYRYCRHSKKSERLKRRIESRADIIAYYEDKLKRIKGEGEDADHADHTE